jgi:ABC-type Na+ efflux pump permease subunit
MKRFRKPLLLAHVIASVGLLGATSSSLLLAIVADGDRDVYELISLQSAVFGIPLSFVALMTGFALGFATKWGVLRHWWTTLKLALLVGVILNGALMIGPTTARLMDGEGSASMLVVAAGGSVLMLAVSVGLSVYKPGGRVRRATAVRHAVS